MLVRPRHSHPSRDHFVLFHQCPKHTIISCLPTDLSRTNVNMHYTIKQFLSLWLKSFSKWICLFCDQVTQYLTVLKQFTQPRLAFFLFVTWFMGIGSGIVFSFLFWHLQELGGSPTLYGIASIINYLSEIVTYYFSKPAIERFGKSLHLHYKLHCIEIITIPLNCPRISKHILKMLQFEKIAELIITW